MSLYRFRPPNWSLGEARDLTTGQGPVRASFGLFDDFGGFDQIIGGYYDVVHPEDSSSDKDKQNFVKERARRYFKAAKANGTITGCCYYTTKKNVEYLEVFSQAVDEMFGN